MAVTELKKIESSAPSAIKGDIKTLADYLDSVSSSSTPKVPSSSEIAKLTAAEKNITAYTKEQDIDLGTSGTHACSSASSPETCTAAPGMMKRSAGSIALLGGVDGWSPAARPTVTCCTSRSRTRCWSFRPRRRSSVPSGRSSGLTEWFAGLGASATGLGVLNRRDAEADDIVAATGPAVRLPRRRVAAPPPLGVEGQPALRRVALRARARRGDRGFGAGATGSATRWSTAAPTPSGSAS